MRSSCLAIAALVLAVSSTALADPLPDAPEPLKTHSPWLMGGGIGLVVVGTASTISGLALTVQASQSRGEFPLMVLSLPLLVHGLGCLAGGIPMIAIGAKKIPVNPSRYARSPTPLVMVTPSSASLRWSF